MITGTNIFVTLRRNYCTLQEHEEEDDQIILKTTTLMDNTADKAIRITQIFNAPLDLLWETWTSPDHISNWWGPAGFTTTIHEMNIKVEGSWKLTLHGPDGKNYPNRSIYKEIIPKEKLYSNTLILIL